MIRDKTAGSVQWLLPVSTVPVVGFGGGGSLAGPLVVPRLSRLWGAAARQRSLSGADEKMLSWGGADASGTSTSRYLFHVHKPYNRAIFDEI
jgi:hypothetical protein